MPKSPISRIRALPAADEHWLVVIHHLRMWITPPALPPRKRKAPRQSRKTWHQ